MENRQPWKEARHHSLGVYEQLYEGKVQERDARNEGKGGGAATGIQRNAVA